MNSSSKTGSLSNRVYHCKDHLLVIKRVELSIAFILVTSTLLLILGHPRFRKRHHIFPFNLALADLTGVIVYVNFEVKRIMGQEGSSTITNALIPALYASLLVSNVSILLVAFYRYITIRLDPFGVRNIITTTRCVIVCIVTWVIAGGLFAISNMRIRYYHILPLCTTIISLGITIICYIFIYRSVAKVSSDGNSQLEERKKENQRVLRTFCLILGTSVLFSLYPIGFWFYLSSHLKSELSACYIFAEEIVITANWIANCVIYWWRLQEFRSIICSCTKCRNTLNPQVMPY